jgi:hypothetical protein
MRKEFQRGLFSRNDISDVRIVSACCRSAVWRFAGVVGRATILITAHFRRAVQSFMSDSSPDREMRLRARQVNCLFRGTVRKPRHGF